MKVLSPQNLEKLLSTQYRDMRHSPPAKDRTGFFFPKENNILLLCEIFINLSCVELVHGAF